MPSLIECGSLNANIELCKRLKLDFIELNMNLPQFQLDNLNKINLNANSEDSELFLTLHLPEELNIADFNNKIKKAHIDTVCETIDLADKLNIPIIN